MQRRNFIKSLGKATEILETIRNNKKPISLEEVSRISELNKTTCFRFLQTMLELDIIVQNGGSKNYKLGPKLISLGLSALNSFDLHREAIPVMRELREDTGETVNLSILDGPDLLIIERFRSNHLYNANLTVGSRLPLHCTSQGKAILAFLKDERLEKLLSCIKFKKYTDKTVKNKIALKTQLSEIKKVGYSINKEEFEIGIAAIAGPIVNHAGEAVAALNVSFPLARHPNKFYVKQISEKVLKACKRLSFYQGHL
jgi:DNA-binding IclR family transcriptional regulator